MEKINIKGRKEYMAIDVKFLKNDLLEYGMVSENLPDYINTKGMSKVNFKMFTSTEGGSMPVMINLRKNDGGNRIISLPNPASYQQLINIIFSDKNIFEKIINKIENNKYSQSKIIYNNKEFNIPIKKYKSKYMESRREKMILSIGKRYCLKYDIENFYDSIYTHYLPAGLVGYKNAMAMYKGKIIESDEYKYMVKVDKNIRNLSNLETKGILTGPFISRIFSELLLSEIDNEIFSTIENDNFRRFVDDVEIYEYTKEKEEKNIEKIKNILQKYKLSMKMEKTKIKEMPFMDFNTFRDLMNIRRKINSEKVGWYFAFQDDLFEAIDKAEKLNSNNKGALKYILKYLGGQKYEYGINKEYKEKSESILYLLNYIVVYPQYAKEILKIINANVEKSKVYEELLNRELKEFLEKDNDMASLFLIELIIQNKMTIDDELIFKYLKREGINEIVEATLICYLCENNVEGKYSIIIQEQVEKLRSGKTIEFNSDSWLSKYTLFYFDYIVEDDCDIKDKFYQNFKLYKENNIKFINLKK